MYREKNTGTNLPAQIEIFATDGDAYKFLFMAKGGGSANKSYLYQETKALLNPDSLLRFCADKIKALGTAARPPYHLAVVIGGTLSYRDTDHITTEYAANLWGELGTALGMLPTTSE